MLTILFGKICVGDMHVQQYTITHTCYTLYANNVINGMYLRIPERYHNVLVVTNYRNVMSQRIQHACTPFL